MRTTLNIDDDILRHLKQQAVKSRVPFKRLVNSILRAGLRPAAPARARKAYSCPAYRMGEPRIKLDKALTLAANLEDAEILRELELRK